MKHFKRKRKGIYTVKERDAVTCLLCDLNPNQYGYWSQCPSDCIQYRLTAPLCVNILYWIPVPEETPLQLVKWRLIGCEMASVTVRGSVLGILALLNFAFVFITGADFIRFVSFRAIYHNITGETTLCQGKPSSCYLQATMLNVSMKRSLIGF